MSVRTAQRTAGYAALVGVCAALVGPAAADGAAAGVLAAVCVVLAPLWLGAGLLLPALRRRAVWG
ncbi:MAG: hypothetical protein ACKO9D_10720, partial [Gammaproteobacteria bacterium]